MYAMDTAVHLEHSNETRRSRWDLRRSTTGTAGIAATASRLVESSATLAGTHGDPVHDFID